MKGGNMRTLIAANWKMHGSMDWVDKPARFDAILSPSERKDIDVLICPPALYIAPMTAASDTIAIGAQNCHHADTGAHTGEISAKMIKDAGASYVIVGHSERREAGETDADVQAKAIAAASLPSGETDIVIAYEPIWAIGTGKVPTLEDIDAMHNHIRKIVGDRIRILYGGSVKPANAKEILAIDNVNGALIGGASLEMESLADIARLG